MLLFVCLVRVKLINSVALISGLSFEVRTFGYVILELQGFVCFGDITLKVSRGLASTKAKTCLTDYFNGYLVKLKNYCKYA